MPCHPQEITNRLCRTEPKVTSLENTSMKQTIKPDSGHDDPSSSETSLPMLGTSNRFASFDNDRHRHLSENMETCPIVFAGETKKNL